MLTQAKLKEYLKYNPDTGLFTRIKISVKNQCKLNEIAGSIHAEGHITITFFGKSYQAHKLAYLYINGNLPIKFIDHINGDRTDNRWCNLREATPRQNSQNQRKAHSHNVCGFLGVNFRKETNKYRARIRHNGILINIGQYDTPEEAHQAYLIEKRKLHEFCTI